MKKKQTKQKILDGFDNSKTKSVLDICRIAGIAANTFYYHLNKDHEFRREFIEKKRAYLATKL